MWYSVLWDFFKCPECIESNRLDARAHITSGIEGPAVDSEGNLYAVIIRRRDDRYCTPDGSHGCFLVLPEGSTGNSIRFGKTEICTWRIIQGIIS